MKTIGNVLWFVLVGIWAAIGWWLSAALFAITIVGLPIAKQCMKFASFTLWPFGRQAIKDPAASPVSGVLNVVWLVPGTLLALIYVLGGALLCVTVIGIPFGIQSFKFAGLCFQPFGKRIVRTKDLATAYTGAAPVAAPAAPAMAGTWQPDPSGRHQLRYHDGAQWTTHVSTGGVQSADPVG